MRTGSITQASDISWETFQRLLPAYVRMALEQSVEQADNAYPDVALCIGVSPECEAIYYREFRKQGRRKSVDELQQIGQRHQVADTMTQIAAAAQTQQACEDIPSWARVQIEHGLAWIDRTTERWRRLEFSLSDLSLGPTPQATMAGMMGSSKATPEAARRTLHVAPDTANFEVLLSVLPDVSVGPNRCRLEIAVTLMDRIGEFSGIRVAITQEDVVRTATTDEQGKAFFDNLACDKMGETSVVIDLPA